MNGRKAFTLIEMLVVVAIVAVIAALIFPVFAKAKQSGFATQDITQLRQVYMGLQMYRADYEQNYPLSLADVGGSYVHKQILASPVDRRTPDAAGTYPADRFLDLPGEPNRRVSYKMSYAYLRAFEGRFPMQGLWDYYIQSSKWSVLVCADYLTTTSMTPSPSVTDHGTQTDSGTFLRIRMDGSLRKVQKKGMGISVGGSYEELFYYPDESPGSS